MKKTTSHYALLLTNLAKKSGIDITKLISESDGPVQSTQTDQEWIDNGYVADVIKALWRQSDDELFGLSDDGMRLGTWAISCNYMMIAETLGELFRLGEEINSYLPPKAMQIKSSLHGQDCDIRVDCYQGEQDPNRFLTEFITVTWHRFPCWAIDEYIPLKDARFSYPEPQHSWFYEELFQCPVLFDQSQVGFTFDQKYLSKQICRNRSELKQWLRNSPADLLYLPGRDNTIASYVRKELDKELRDNMRFPAFDYVCEQLHMSNQVVRRRLKEEGENFQHLKDLVRSDLIKEILINTELPLAEITQRAGFREVASLSRAFKRWTDLTPAEYRKNHTKSLTDSQ